jgi:hypothetical protein
LNGTTGLISGTPTASGNASILLYATNAYGNGTKTLTISVANLLPAVTSNNSTTATLGVPFNYQITATNAPLTGYAVIGTLPTGLALSTTSGLISGTPTASGNFLLNLIAKNSAGNSTAAPLSITIAPAVTFSISGPINQKVLAGTNATFSVSNAVASTANATLSYQWYKNGLTIGNATASIYTISTLNYSTAGAYSVKVTTKVGTTTIDLGPPLLSGEVIASIVNKAIAMAKVTEQFAVLYPVVKKYLSEYAFGISIDLDVENVRRLLADPEYETPLVEVIASAIGKEVTKTTEIRLEPNPYKLSETESFIWRRQTAKAEKTIFNLTKERLFGFTSSQF